jgi:hypothetical protein
MVSAGHFDADDGVFYIIRLNREFQYFNRVLKIAMSMFDDGRFDKNSTVEVPEEPLGSRLGTVDTHNAKVLWSRLLDTRLNDAGGLANDSQREGFRTSFFTLFVGFSGCSHYLCLSFEKRYRNISKHGSKYDFFKFFRYVVFRTTYQGTFYLFLKQNVRWFSPFVFLGCGTRRRGSAREQAGAARHRQRSFSLRGVYGLR